MKLELVARKHVSHVEMQKDEKYSLGMKIVDGTKDEAGPVIRKVKSKSPAGRSLAIGEGDVILSLNGISMVGTKGKDIIRMIKESGNCMDFKLQYEMRKIQISEACVFRKQQRKIVLHKVKDDFGFILRKEGLINFLADDYPVISNIKPGSYVHRHSLIHEGDRLLKVDDVSLSCLSLGDIACLLQSKNTAEFTYQYDVGVVDFAESRSKVDLDIVVPNADLGLYLTTFTKDSGLMYIEKIRLGSIAERCGLFREGDIILSIGEIDTRFLTVSKASVLLQNYKKCRKISFIPSKRKGKSLRAERIIDQWDSVKADGAATKSYETQSWKQNPLNTSASSNVGFPSKQEFYLQQLCFDDQIQSINNLQSIVRVVTNLKQMQSQLNVEKKALNANNYCLLCDGSQHCAKFCLSCLAKINASCGQSIHVLQNMVSYYVARSFKDSARFEGNEEGKDNSLAKVSTEELVHALAETLPNVFDGESRLKEQFRAISEKIMHADASCYICDFEIKSVWITVKKLLLLLSLDYNRPDIKVLINQLIFCLLKMKFSCDPLFTSNDDDIFQPETPLDTPSIYYTADTRSCYSDCYSTQTKDNTDSESVKMRVAVESNPPIPQKDYLKITHIENLSTAEESGNENDLCEADMDAKSFVEKYSFSRQENNPGSSSTSLKLDDATSKRDEKIYKGKVFNQKPAKFWRSSDSILKSSGATKDQTEVPRKISQNTSKCRMTNTSGMGKSVASTSSDYAASRLSANPKPSTTGAHASGFNDGSAQSSFSNTSQKGGQHRSRKVRTETMEVKMTNNGEGFGLGLGLKFLSDKCSVAPVIQTIKPKSPSQKSGVLKIDDRVIAINRQSTMGLTPKKLQILKNRAFSADAITLTVQFDVANSELKGGTFDLVLDKKLKIGLIFEDMQRGYPMVVSGIVKGSAAHRCGQLFPGDKIKFFRFLRNEEFYPVSCNYTKEESVLITVQRDRIEGFQKKSANASPCYFNPCFSHKDSVPRRGSSFIVKSSAIHVIEGTDALVLDQEVTLFRDPVSCDFGFLVGENPDTGRAYVTDVRPDGPASKCGVIKKFDKIVEVNGIPVDKNVENSVLSLLSQANHRVDLLIRRLYHEGSNSA